jgi:ketosteroid isomerase-like protein
MATEPRDLDARLTAIEDRLAIEDVIVRYAHAVDGHDDERLAACFTDDAQATFAGVPAGPGGAAIAAFLAATMGGANRPATTHRFTNVAVTLAGDEADVQSSAVVYAVRGEPEQLRLRGVTYRDHFVRTPAGWRIGRRVHSVAWEGAADSVPLTPIRPSDA